MYRNIVALCIASLAISVHTQPALCALDFTENDQPFFKKCLVGAGIAGGITASIIAYECYKSHHDKHVDKEKVIQELEKEFIQLAGRVIKDGAAVTQANSMPLVDDPDALVRAIVTTYGESKYAHLDYARHISRKINALQTVIKQDVIPIYDGINAFLEDTVTIDQIIPHGAWKRRKQNILSQFYWYCPSLSNSIAKGPSSEEVRNQLSSVSKKLLQIINAYKPMKTYLIDLRLAIEQMPEYKQEQIQEAEDARLQKMLDAQQRQQEAQHAHEIDLEKARRPKIINTVKVSSCCPYCYSQL